MCCEYVLQHFMQRLLEELLLHLEVRNLHISTTTQTQQQAMFLSRDSLRDVLAAPQPYQARASSPGEMDSHILLLPHHTNSIHPANVTSLTSCSMSCRLQALKASW